MIINVIVLFRQDYNLVNIDNFLTHCFQRVKTHLNMLRFHYMVTFTKWGANLLTCVMIMIITKHTRISLNVLQMGLGQTYGICVTTPAMVYQTGQPS